MIGTRTVLMLIVVLLLIGQTGFTQEVNDKIWSRAYWQNIPQEQQPYKNKHITPKAAVYKGSEIFSKTTRYIDAPDVPVTTQENNWQSENSIFVSPLDNNVVLNSNNSVQGSPLILFGTSGYFTMDGSATWGGSEQGTGGSNSGDPAAAIGTNGWFYVGYISSSPDGGQGVAYSTNNGSTWTHTLAGNPTGGAFFDKNHMWIDNSTSSPYEGHLYSAWTDFGGPADNNIQIAASFDEGLTWNAPINISAGVSAGSHNQGVNIQTGPNGEVYATWAIYDSWPSDETALGFAKSLDGGSTWEAPQRIITNIKGIRNTETSKNMRVNSFPVMAVDISGGSASGTIYIVWNNVGVPGINSGSDIDVYMIKSSDGGDTWASPVKVNQDASSLGKEHYMAWITCDPVTSDLHVIFYDDRNVASTDCETFVSSSTDGGNTWEDYRVGDVSFTPGPLPGLASGYFGDYIGITARGGKVYPVWTDNRLGSGSMAYVSPYSVADPEDPKAPEQLHAYSDFTTPNSIYISWTDPVELINGDPLFNFQIEIWRGDDSIAAVDSGIEEFTDIELTDGTYYEYSLYTRDLDSDSLSYAANVAFTAGGSPVPAAPSDIVVVGNTDTVKIYWRNPNRNVDNTPMDDFAGINLYRDNQLVATYDRNNTDTSAVDSAGFTNDIPDYYRWYVTSFDNEEPVNESAHSATAITPIGYPFAEGFEGDLGLFVESGNVSWNVNGSFFIAGSYSIHNAHSDNNENIIETVGSLNLSQATNPKLSFYQICKTEGGYDYGHIEYSLNGGSSWQVFPLSAYEGDGDYAGEQFHEDSYSDWGTDDQTPANDWWKFEIFDLSSFVGETNFKLRFRLTSDGSVTRYGWLIDAVSIAEPDNNPVMSVSPMMIYDTLLAGGENTRYFGVSNEQTGLSTLTFGITGADLADWLILDPESGTVSQSSTENIALHINTAGLEPGDHSVNLTVSGDDENNPEEVVAVYLHVLAAPEISVLPDTLRASINPDMTDTVSFYIKNNGDGILTIDGINDQLLFKGNIGEPQEQQITSFYEKGVSEPVFSPVLLNAGGPDSYGYTWKDSDEPGGPVYDWFDISSLGINSGIDEDDQFSGPFDMGFEFTFYGESYNQIYISSNGWLSFSSSASAYYSNGRIPSTETPNNILAPFWDDLTLVSSGNIFYYYDQVNRRFIVQYQDVPHYSSGGPYTFQVMLYESGVIKYQYHTMNTPTNSATLGIENTNGTIGLEVVYNAEYLRNEMAVQFSRGASWMTISEYTSTILPGDSVEVNLVLNSAGMALGEYSTMLKVESNDPVYPLVENPVLILSVEEPNVVNNDLIVPASYQLHQNYPNPFNPTTTIRYDLKKAQTVTLSIFNLLGEEVRTLVNNVHQNASGHMVEWDATDNAGRKVSSGIYIYRITAGEFVKSRKLLLLK